MEFQRKMAQLEHNQEARINHQQDNNSNLMFYKQTS